jgi:hypothetical protein
MPENRTDAVLPALLRAWRCVGSEMRLSHIPCRFSSSLHPLMPLPLLLLAPAAVCLLTNLWRA